MTALVHSRRLFTKNPSVGGNPNLTEKVFALMERERLILSATVELLEELIKDLKCEKKGHFITFLSRYKL